MCAVPAQASLEVQIEEVNFFPERRGDTGMFR
jgi:hypothetical protein